MSLADFEDIRALGSGVYGDIYLCNTRATNDVVCVKRIPLHDLSPTQRNLCWNEVRVAASLQHPNIVRHHDAFVDAETLAIVMEFCDGGDLAEWLYDHRADASEDKLLLLFVQMALAVQHMHASNVLHRDLKPKNMFVFETGRLVVGDFGIAKCLESSASLAETLIGSPAYMAPEIFEGQPYGLKADVWALGCILYELMTGRCPFRASSYPALVHKISAGDYDALAPTTCRLPTRHLIAAMLAHDPNDRPSIESILTLPFLQPSLDEYLALAPSYLVKLPPTWLDSLVLQRSSLVPPPIAAPGLAVNRPETIAGDLKQYVKAKHLGEHSLSVDARAIVQLRAKQTAQRQSSKSKKGQKSPLPLPLCDIHLLDAHKISVPLATRKPKARSPGKPSTLPPPPPIGVRSVYPSPVVLSPRNNNQRSPVKLPPSFLVIGTQLTPPKEAQLSAPGRVAA
ncbi:NEK protein kinase [Saprolegnia diclina VS20]|uniref:non-specific serine/threonine protein kinase n=1 Tax=Saprolegnia diclina (strain VS20) TaxID=1156394 RepID=T0PWX7_SAPDV|nr:NEK protein kinase [Saprolegnia diclina VS20]EQC25515.1 NEK protein kinase [Saprolegnia diclina VS20]|eukprot:XP_008621059.1 NEK protein kinase [Saprolegnia diclina VS20]